MLHTYVCVLPPHIMYCPHTLCTASGLARCKYKTALSTKKLDAGTVAYM